MLYFTTLARSPCCTDFFYKNRFGAYLPDVIIYSQFHINQWQGFDSVRGRISPFPIGKRDYHAARDSALGAVGLLSISAPQRLQAQLISSPLWRKWKKKERRQCKIDFFPLTGSLNDVLLMTLINVKKQAQLSLTNRAMLSCKVVEVMQDVLSENIDKKFTTQVPNYYSTFDTIILLWFYNWILLYN